LGFSSLLISRSFAQYAWFEPVLVAALLVFIVDFIGSVIVFSRWPALNGLASAILFALIFGALVYSPRRAEKPKKVG
jgi:hypothetical protein